MKASNVGLQRVVRLRVFGITRFGSLKNFQVRLSGSTVRASGVGLTGYGFGLCRV